MAVEIEVDADLARFLRRIDDLSDAAHVEARQIARALDQGIGGTSARLQGSVDGLAARFSGLGNVAEKALKKLGGAGNEAADVLFDFAIPLGEATAGLGALGTAAAGVGAALLAAGLAIGGTVAGMVAIATAAESARDRLEEAGLAAYISDEARASSERYRVASTQLQVAVDRLTIEIAGDEGLTDALVGLIRVTTVMVDKAREWTGSFLDAASSTAEFAGRLAPIVGLVSPVTGKLLEAAGATDDLVEALRRAGSAPNTSLAGVLPPPLLLDEVKLGVESVATALDTRLSPALVQTTSRFREATEEMREHFRREVQDVAAEVNGLTVSASRVGIAIQDTTQTLSNASKEDLAILRDHALAAIGNVFQGVSAITDQIVAQYERRVAAGEELGTKEMKAANRLAALSKVAQIGAMTVNAVSTWFSLTRDLAAIPGNAAFAPFEAAGIIAASMIAPAAQIIGSPIPFPNVEENVGKSPTFQDPVEERGTAAGYADAFGAGNLSGGGGSNRSAASNGQFSVVVSVTPVQGVGKIRFSGVR